MNEADYLERQLTLFTECEELPTELTQDSSSGKMSQEPLVPIKGLIFVPCLKKSDRPRFQCLPMGNGQKTEWLNYLDVRSPGGFSMLNGGYLRGAKESSLSQILQPPTDVPEKYYLSSRACQGIIRRAKERGKELPEALRMALEAQSRLGNEQANPVVAKAPCLQ